MKKVIKLLIFLIIFLVMLIIICKINLDIQEMKIRKEVEKSYEGYGEGYDYILKNPESVINGQLPSKVDSESIFLSVERNLKNYLNYVENSNIDYVRELLDEEYFKKIEAENGKLNSYKNSENFFVREMYTLKGIQYFTYYVYGKIGINDLYYTLNWDSANNTFSIIQLDEDQYNELIKTKGVSEGGLEKTIPKKTYNSFDMVAVKDEITVLDRILKEYVATLDSNIDEAYDKLNLEYKNKNFNNIESFKVYISKNFPKLRESTIIKYSTILEGNIKLFECEDQYNNKFKIKYYFINNFEIQL